MSNGRSPTKGVREGDTLFLDERIAHVASETILKLVGWMAEPGTARMKAHPKLVCRCKNDPDHDGYDTVTFMVEYPTRKDTKSVYRTLIFLISEGETWTSGGAWVLHCDWRNMQKDYLLHAPFRIKADSTAWEVKFIDQPNIHGCDAKQTILAQLGAIGPNEPVPC
jgi:hypothetical protein